MRPRNGLWNSAIFSSVLRRDGSLAAETNSGGKRYAMYGIMTGSALRKVRMTAEYGGLVPAP
ncbi:hypothetical protein BCh11DRAFT_04403 [Burkholderia sp. Ch1-1]|nr:hypothetical protein BCh11DRAFT_04403 [Burkholderia sp. Ch1-1]